MQVGQGKEQEQDTWRAHPGAAFISCQPVQRFPTGPAVSPGTLAAPLSHIDALLDASLESVLIAEQSEKVRWLATPNATP